MYTQNLSIKETTKIAVKIRMHKSANKYFFFFSLSPFIQKIVLKKKHTTKLIIYWQSLMLAAVLNVSSSAVLLSKRLKYIFFILIFSIFPCSYSLLSAFQKFSFISSYTIIIITIIFILAHLFLVWPDLLFFLLLLVKRRQPQSSYNILSCRNKTKTATHTQKNTKWNRKKETHQKEGERWNKVKTRKKSRSWGKGREWDDLSVETQLFLRFPRFLSD